MNHRERTLRHCEPQGELPFSRREYRERLERIRRAMAAARIDVLWLTAPESMCYVSGFQAEYYEANGPKDWAAASGIALRVDSDRLIAFDTGEEELIYRYTTVVDDVRLFPGRREAPGFFCTELAAQGWLKPGTVVGLELHSYRPVPAMSMMFRQGIEGAGAQVVDGSMILREVRWVKSPAEIACIERAGLIADIGLRRVGEVLRPGITELEVYGEMLAAMAAAGGEMPGIVQPVLSGPKANTAHALASRKRILEGEHVNVDVSGVHNRYHANMARAWRLGEPPRHVMAYFEKIAGVFDAVRPHLRANMPVRELNRLARAYYEDAGIWRDGQWLGGYEMGIAFPPDWVGNYVYEFGDDATEDVFEPGTAVNFESVFYLPDMAGIGPSLDTLVFTEAGGRFLSREPYGLTVVE